MTCSLRDNLFNDLIDLDLGLDSDKGQNRISLYYWKLKNEIWKFMLEQYPFIQESKNQGLENQIQQKSSVLFFEVSGSAFKDYVIQARAYLSNYQFQNAINNILNAERQRFRTGLPELYNFGLDTEFSLLDVRGEGMKAIRKKEEVILAPIVTRLNEIIDRCKIYFYNNDKAKNLFFTQVPKLPPENDKYEMTENQKSIAAGFTN